jgi:glycosyltransferase involved in cell wall biosynthesis
MKLGFVVQRYGSDISGGAELHARLVAEHLSKRHEVEVFTTCAKDYVTWKNEYPSGKSSLNGVTIHRFPVKHPRNIRRFFDIQNLVFAGLQSMEFQERWIKENGPYCPRLIREAERRRDINTWIIFSYRYWTSVQALRVLSGRKLLVPTAENDPALYLTVFNQIFNLPDAIVYNSLEEKHLIHNVSQNQSVSGDVVGVGLEETPFPTMDMALPRFGKDQPYLIYVGRIDKNKGCDRLFRYFNRFCRDVRSDVKLLLIGTPVIAIPEMPHIKHLGFVSEEEKNRAILASCALIMPSPYESLSMVVLESWRAGRPVIVNGACEVLHGQCIRSNGGIPYHGFEMFSHAVQLLVDRAEMADKLGEQGMLYYNQHYRWEVIESKYERLLNQ